jgi:ATP-dependent DNA ligase
VVVTPPVLIAFDALYVPGRDPRARPLSYRRPALEDGAAGASLIYPARGLDGDGFEAFAEMKRRSCEGLVAKTRWRPGRRHPRLAAVR